MYVGAVVCRLSHGSGSQGGSRTVRSCWATAVATVAAPSASGLRGQANVCRYSPRRMVHDLKQDLLSGCYVSELRRLEFRDMSKEILCAVVWRDETKPVLLVEPLYRTGPHL
jgi:hypothetical protein